MIKTVYQAIEEFVNVAHPVYVANDWKIQNWETNRLEVPTLEAIAALCMQGCVELKKRNAPDYATWTSGRVAVYKADNGGWRFNLNVVTGWEEPNT